MMRFGFHVSLVLAALSVSIAGALAPHSRATQQPPVADAPRRAQAPDDLTQIRDLITGNGLLNRGMYDLAVEEYRRFLRDHADHARAAEARYGLGVALFRLGRFDDAAKELAPLKDAEGFAFEAEANLLLGQAHLQRGAPAEAVEPLARVLRRHPDHRSAGDAAALLVEASYRAGRFAPAREEAQKSIEAHPDHALRDRVEYFDGLSALALEQFADAASRLESLLKRSPDSPFTAQATLLAGRALHRAQSFDLAAARYRAALGFADRSLHPEALYGLAVILRRGGSPEEALTHLDRLLAEFDDDALIEVARFERGRSLFDLQRFDEAAPSFAAVSNTHELADDAAYWRAKCAFRADRFAEAAEVLGEAIAAHPQSALRAEMQYDLAVAHLRAENTDDAIAALREFRRGFAEHDLAGEALYLLISATHRLGEYAQSDLHCEEFFAEHVEHPRIATVRYLHAENPFLSGDLDAAADRFSAFLASHPDGAQASHARFRLGTALYRLDRTDESRAMLMHIVSGPDTPAAYITALFALGDMAFGDGRWKDAVDFLDQYLSFSPEANIDDALIRIGLARQRLGEPAAAVETFDALLSRADSGPHRAQALFEKGQALLAMERHGEAEAAFIALIELDDVAPFEIYALNHLGALTMSEKRYQEALQWYERLAAAEAPDDLRAEALFQHGQALVALERFDDAVSRFERLLNDFPEHDRANLARANIVLCHAREGLHADTLAAIAGVSDDDRDALPTSLRATLLYEQAWALRALDRTDEAVAVYRRMIDDDDAADLDRHALVELAELDASRGAHDSAAASLARADLDDEGFSDDLRGRAWYLLGASRYELGDFEGAAEPFERLLSRYPDHPRRDAAALFAGESHFRRGEHAQAAALLGPLCEIDGSSRAKDVDPTIRGPALLRLGESLAHLQKFAASEATFRAHRRDFDDSPVWFQAQFGLGWALENQGKFDDAITAYRVVVDRHQGETAARAQFQIGECHFAKKEYDVAARELLKVDILYAYPEWSAAALYEAGRCFEAMAQIGTAREQYEQIRRRYPESQWAALSAERLAALARSDRPGRGGSN